MEEFLKKIKLIDYLTTNLQISRTEFVNRLTSITDQGGIGMFSETFDAFSSSKNEFKGEVSLNGFRIKRRSRFFDTNINTAIANGTITEDNHQLVITTEINGFRNFFIIFYLFLVIFYSIFIFGFTSSDNNDGFFVIPFILLHGTLMFSLPYFMMRRSVKRLKYELEREFFYLTKNN